MNDRFGWLIVALVVAMVGWLYWTYAERRCDGQAAQHMLRWKKVTTFVEGGAIEGKVTYNVYEVEPGMEDALVGAGLASSCYALYVNRGCWQVTAVADEVESARSVKVCLR